MHFDKKQNNFQAHVNLTECLTGTYWLTDGDAGTKLLNRDCPGQNGTYGGKPNHQRWLDSGFLLSDPVFEKWYPYPIRILFWLKSSYLYPKTIKKCIMMHNIYLCALSILPHEATGFQLYTTGWSSHMTSLERISCLVEHDIYNSSIPSMVDACHGFRAGKQLAASCLH